MGGNVFKDYLDNLDSQYVGRRLKTEDYPSALFAVISILTILGLEYRTIFYVREKESHGDLDILVVKNESISPKDFSNILKSNGFKVEHNQDIVSILLLTFQVDFIFINEASIDYAQNYFSWNDLGNIVGRISKQVGLKHGHDGLYYVQRDGDKVLHEHKLSNDYFTTLNILGLDVQEFKNGFDTYYDMFEWASKSPFFNYESFKFENLNHRNRVRDKKRKIYNMFLEWCNNRDFSEPHSLQNNLEFIFEKFPELETNIKYYEQKNLNRKLLCAKFNGNIVSEITGLIHKELGKFIAEFRQEYSDEILCNLSADDIKSLVKTFHQKSGNPSN